MRIRAIRVAGVGPFRSGVAVEDFSGGLDMLIAPNETGKSTLFRALTALFRESYTAANPRTRALQPVGGGSPVVEVEFDMAGRTWRFTKRWFGQKLAQLVDLEAGRTLRGADAENEAATLLAVNLDRSAMTSLLWVEQTKSFVIPAAEDKAGQTLARIVEGEIAGAIGSGQARAVRGLVNERLSALMTDARTKPKAGTEYAKALAAVADLEIKLERAAVQASASQARLAKLAGLRSEEARLTEPAAAQELAANLSRLAETIAAAKAAEAECANARLAREAAALRSRTATQFAEEFDERIRKFARLSRQLETSADSHRRLTGMHAELQARHATSRVEVVRANEALSEARAALASARNLNQRIERRDRLAEVESRLAKARSAATELEAASRDAGSIDPEFVRQLRTISAERDRLTAELNAGAPRLAFALEPAGLGKVTITGRVVVAGETITASDEVAVEIAGVGRITVSPGGGQSQDEARRRLANADRLIAEKLAVLGVATLAEAEQRHEQARAADQVARTARARIDALAPDGISALENEAADLRSGLYGVADDAIPQDLAFLQSALDDARTQAETATASEKDAAHRLQVVETELAVLVSALDRDTRELDEVSALLPAPAERDEQAKGLTAAASTAREDLENAVLVEQAWQRRLPAPDALGRLEREHRDLLRQKESMAARLEDLRREMAAIEGALARDGETGSAAAEAEIAVELSAAQARVSRFAQEAAALMMLDQVLGDVEREDRDNLGLPIRARLEAYAGRIVPGIEVLLGEGFAVRSVQRLDRAETPAMLSTGTVEQIGIFSRLAYARLLADQGHPVPVVLDDPLVYADDDRLARMFDVLSEASRHHQIVVLSCREAAFRPLGERAGARSLQLVDWQPRL